MDIVIGGGSSPGWWLSLAPAAATAVGATIAATAAILASHLTSKLAARRSMQERIWDRRADAYSAIFEALDVMNRWADDEFEDAIQNTRASNAVRTGRAARYRDAREKLLQTSAREIWLLSPATRTALTALNRELDVAVENFDWMAELQKTSTALSKAIQTLTALAVDELQTGHPAVPGR